MRRVPRLVGIGVVAALTALTMLPGATAHATFGGHDGRIAFDDFTTGQIYAINPDGTGLAQLTHVGEGEFAGDPAWSPDGNHIAFESNKGGPLVMWIMDANGNHQHRVGPEPADRFDLWPTYTPDGRRLIFTRFKAYADGGFAGQLASIRVDGTHRRALTPLQGPPFEIFDFEPSVSPDGTRVAFDRLENNTTGIFRRVFVMEMAGSHLHPVTPPVLEGFSPDWSPDGDRIAFTSDCCRLGSEGYTVNAGGNDIRQLTRQAFPHNDIYFAYSPSGKSMVFGSDRRYPDICCVDMFVMRASGADQTRIPTGLPGAVDFAWGTAPLAPATSGSLGSRVSPARVGSTRATSCRDLPEPVQIAKRCGPARTFLLGG